MSSLFLSDLHLEDDRPETARLLGSFLDGPARRAAAVYILGDLFEYWIGDDAPPPEGIELANGYHELTDPAEQRRRFDADLAAADFDGALLDVDDGAAEDEVVLVG